MGSAEAGADDALDDAGRVGRVVGSPVVGDGLGEATEFDDGEFTGEAALEGVDAATELGEVAVDGCEGHGVITSLWGGEEHPHP